MLDLETQLRAYGDQLDRQFPAVTVDEALHRPIRSARPTATLLRRGPVVAVVAAAAVVILIGAVALFLRDFPEDTPPVVTQPDTEADPPPPDTEADPAPVTRAEAGFPDVIVVETSLGTWTWQRQPDIRPGESTERPRPPLPQPAVDGIQWWSPYWEDGGTASLGDVTVSVISAGVGVDLPSLYDYEPGRVAAGWLVPGEVIEISGVRESLVEDGDDETGETLDVLEVSIVPGDPDAVEFRRRDGGELVLRLEATDPALPAELLVEAALPCDGLAGCPVVLRRLLVETGTDGVWVDPPWAGPVVDAAVTVGADGLVLLAVEGPAESPTIRWWWSRDGLAWTELPQAAPVVAAESGVRGVHLTGDGERLVLVILDEHVPGRPDGVGVWTSTDASTWERSRIGFPQDDFAIDVGAIPTSFGWMMTGLEWYGGQPQCVVWVSADAGSWEKIYFLPAPLPPGVASQCNSDIPLSAAEPFDTDTVVAHAFDFWGSDLGWWRGGFTE